MSLQYDSSIQVVGANGAGMYSGQGVDPTFLAARVALRPLEYKQAGTVLGHYRVAQKSGAVAATLAANAHAGSIRWAPSQVAYLVLLRIRAAWSVLSAVTTATPMDLRAIKCTGFTTDFTTNATAADMATLAATNAMRTTMSSSLMATSGPRILTTAAMSGQTLTPDANPIGCVNWPVLYPVTATGTTVALPAGAGGIMQDVYNISDHYQHPVVLSQYEGVLLQPMTACFASGTFNYYFEWTWAEVVLFGGE